MKRLHKLQNVNNGIERLWPESDVPAVKIAQSTEQETAHLQASLDEYDATLKKANKRIERLMGEKSQLKSLLDKRDREIQQLNRELGRLASGRRFAETPEGTISLSPRWPFASLGERIKATFFRTSRAAESTAAKRETDGPGKDAPPSLIARRQNRSSHSIVIAVILGLERDEIERLLPLIERDCASKHLTPLFLIDCDAFELLRNRNQIFEYLPPVGDRDRFDPSMHWDLYIQRRLAVIRKKWDPVRVVAFGAFAMKTLTLWCSSPFEDAPVPAISSETVKSA